MTTRRDFLSQGAATAAGLTLVPRLDPGRHPAGEPSAPGFIDLLRSPDSVQIQSDTEIRPLQRGAAGEWSASGVAVTITPANGALAVALAAPGTLVQRIRLRWRGTVNPAVRVLGDAWERGYGDLEWRGLVADRILPWYFASWEASGTSCYGVMTGPNAFCFWQYDAEGITLWADVRSGGVPLQLGARPLEVCRVTCRSGRKGESPFTALHAFCRQLCPNPILPAHPVYGSNDWYWAYGKNSAKSVRADSQRIVELSPTGSNRPFSVIDDGWQPGRGADEGGIGLWDRGNDNFPDMAALASDIRRIGARPGIWVRPLQAHSGEPDSWRLSRSKEVLDPTVPGVIEKVATDIRRVHEWGYDLIKHDYSTWEIFGRWGMQMGATITRDGWRFAEGPQRTSAEVINALYGTIKASAGDALVIGCNTVSHLSAGMFAICRTGDDTSGNEWNRTRRMGTNTLAFRAVQHNAFYMADPDCVGVTTEQPWALNRQWLDVAARSGTMLMVSMQTAALTPDVERDIRAALAIAAVPQPLGEPLDWDRQVYPTRWRMMGREWKYNWVDPDGSPFPG
jgi:alpha-galactosidase